MSKVRLNSAEAARIQEVAERSAKRTSRRFEMDTQRYEVVDKDDASQPKEQHNEADDDGNAEIQLQC